MTAAEEAASVRAAIALFLQPSRVRAMREEPLAHDTPFLLRIAARDAEALQTAMALTQRPADVILKAAGFYIEQVLLAPDADSYRVLGAHAASSTSDLRQNMAFLLKWIHPDIEANAAQSVYATRVIKAWSDLKTTERRESYDSDQTAKVRVSAPNGDRRSHRGRIPIRPHSEPSREPSNPNNHGKGGFLRRSFGFLLGPRKSR